MTDASARFRLPFILPGQAQKELFHNEALALVDALLHPAIEDAPTIIVPATPAVGACWIVGPGAGGEWGGHDGAIACWTSGGWRFVDPTTGFRAWNKAVGQELQWDGAAWRSTLRVGAVEINGEQVLGSRQPAVSSPSGGTVIDVEARAAIAAIIATFMSHGLTE